MRGGVHYTPIPGETQRKTARPITSVKPHSNGPYPLLLPRPHPVNRYINVQILVIQDKLVGVVGQSKIFGRTSQDGPNVSYSSKGYASGATYEVVDHQRVVEISSCLYTTGPGGDRGSHPRS
jgi:hypothetical protein